MFIQRKRVSCLSADNANCNFGEEHSLYTNVRTLNDGIIKANCSAHIVHNTLKFVIEICFTKFECGH